LHGLNEHPNHLSVAMVLLLVIAVSFTLQTLWTLFDCVAKTCCYESQHAGTHSWFLPTQITHAPRPHTKSTGRKAPRW